MTRKVLINALQELVGLSMTNRLSLVKQTFSCSLIGC